MKVNHIIIGAGRSGTTSLVEYLKQHPAVQFSSIKEVTYFSVNDHYQRGEEYLHSFYEPNDKPIVATSDTYLLMCKEGPKRMAEFNPDMKLTVILRDPSERAYSNYHFSVNNGHIDGSLGFMEAEAQEKEWIKNGSIVEQNNQCHFYGSLYHLHLSNWLKYFNRSQMFICTTRELKENPEGLMNRYIEFLGIEPVKVQPLGAKNTAAGVRNKSLNRFLVNRDHWLRRLIRKPLKSGLLRKIVLKSSVVDQIKMKNQQQMNYPPMTPEDKSFCETYFKEDLRKLKEDFDVSF